WSLSLLNSVELDINSNIYPYQVWITVATFAFNVIMWIVLFINIFFILIKRGKRYFYFDHVSKLIPVRKYSIQYMLIALRLLEHLSAFNFICFDDFIYTFKIF